MSRKLLSSKVIGILAVLLVLFIAAGVAEENRTDASGQWKYVLEDGGATITGYMEEPIGDLVIPGELDGYPVTGIGERILDYLSLASVTIPDSVVDITAYSFNYLQALECIEVAPENPVFESIDGVLFDKRQGMLTAYPTTRSGAYAIPEGTRIIGKNAFYSRQKLTGITLPNSVTSIDYGAFRSCYSLTDIAIPGNVRSIGGSAFELCTSMTNVTLMEGTIEIGEWAFLSCRSLTHVTIPSSVTDIGDNAFSDCGELILAVQEGSVAEQYAKEYNIPYVLAEE